MRSSSSVLDTLCSCADLYVTTMATSTAMNGDGDSDGKITKQFALRRKTVIYGKREHTIENFLSSFKLELNAVFTNFSLG